MCVCVRVVSFMSIMFLVYVIVILFVCVWLFPCMSMCLSLCACVHVCAYVIVIVCLPIYLFVFVCEYTYLCPSQTKTYSLKSDAFFRIPLLRQLCMHTCHTTQSAYALYSHVGKLEAKHDNESKIRKNRRVVSNVLIEH